MATLWLQITAPFAAFRPLQAGAYRSTLPTLPPSAAYGLLLNFAGVEMRYSAPGEITKIRDGLPPLRLAIGRLRVPEKGSLYQQLHHYPVGGTGKEYQAGCHGRKYHIMPTRREILWGMEIVVGAEGEADLLQKIEAGVRGEASGERYGLPFAGDNQLLLDKVEVLTGPVPAEWYTVLAPDARPQRGSCRLPSWNDREVSARSQTLLMAPSTASPAPSDDAWVWVPEL